MFPYRVVKNVQVVTIVIFPPHHGNNLQVQTHSDYSCTPVQWSCVQLTVQLYTTPPASESQAVGYRYLRRQDIL